MTETALSEEAMLASLRDIRLPEAAAGGTLSDALAAVALGLAAALVLAALFRLVAQRRPAARPPALSAQLDTLRGLPEPERRRAILRLMKTHAPDRLRALGPALYRPDTAPPTETLEAELRAHA